MKKIFTTILAILLTAMAYTQTATAPAVGDGSAGNPYQIATLNNLYWISQNPTKWYSHYIQTANINASATSTWNSGAGWQSIGYGNGAKSIQGNL
ncbi:MAG: hypothetical protein KGZ97_03215 [Bacteroidetes bacterium]|nr:hypothetical protein [Bacteroidota bacterium]